MANTLSDFLNRIADALDVISGGKRAFVTGQGAVNSFDSSYGKDDSQFSPAEYGNYIATSNNVFACVTLRSDLLADLPLKVYRGVGDQKTEILNGDIVKLLSKVNPFWTMSRLIKMTQRSLDLWGKSFWFVERGENGLGTPKEIWWAKATQVKVVPDANSYIKGFLYYPINGIEPIPFMPSETIWFRTENPLDEYEGLSPLGAARISADFATDAMRSNRKIFANGLQMAGAMFPPKDGQFSEEQAKTLEIQLDKRFKGVDKAHKFGVFRYPGAIQEIGITPKDAEFVAGLQFSLEEISRAYRVPLDLMGGQRTYANVDASMKMVWTHAILPSGKFITDELKEQFLPMFGAQADSIHFDSSGVAALQKSESEEWTRADQQLTRGVITINEWRADKGLKPVAWGDVAWLPNSLVPVSSGEPITITVPQDTDNPPEPTPPRLLMAPSTRTIVYGSDEHKRLFERFVRRTEKQETTLGKVVAELMTRQKASILARLKQPARTIEQSVDSPFDLAKWIKEFRQKVRPILLDVVSEAGNSALEDVGVSVAFDIANPLVKQFLELRAQRFAKLVNETTWNELKTSLADGLENGENIDSLIERVESVMGERIRSSGETIARTEVIGAVNGGTLHAWEQSEVVVGKEWLAALDARTRETHTHAHGQRVGLKEDFRVGSGKGQGPGLIDLAEETVNCRCSLIAVLDTERGDSLALSALQDVLKRMTIHA